MITKKTVEDKLEIVGEDRIIQIRTAMVVEENGAELSRSYHRHTISPTDDISGETDFVKSLTALLHTPEICERYLLKKTDPDI